MVLVTDWQWTQEQYCNAICYMNSTRVDKEDMQASGHCKATTRRKKRESGMGDMGDMGHA